MPEGNSGIFEYLVRPYQGEVLARHQGVDGGRGCDPLLRVAELQCGEDGNPGGPVHGAAAQVEIESKD
jgi:hypothetical protein